jgi:beta-lactamase regulating signal transducer with metallopeptidase domain
MSPTLLDALAFALFGGGLFALLLAAATAVAERPLLRRLARAAPAQRERLLFALLVAPALGGAGYALLTIASASIGSAESALTGACAEHAGSLWHACVWHPPAEFAPGGSGWWLAVVLAVAAVLAIRTAMAVRQSSRAVAALVRLSRRSDGAWIVDSEQPLAVTAGFGGHVLLSRALHARLSPRQRRIVLAHELAHVAHRDVLRSWLARVLSLLHAPATRRRLRAARDLAVEQRCDRVAAEVVGDPLAVAETIVTVERIFAASPARPAVPLAVAFAHGMADARVRALLAPSAARERGLGAWLFACVPVAALAANGVLHHTTEFVIRSIPW